MAMNKKPKYANHHVPRFLEVTESVASEVLHILKDGSELTAAKIRSGDIPFKSPILVQSSPSSIGMKVPQLRNGIRDMLKFIPMKTPVRVIDVSEQKELEDWSFGDLVEYFVDNDRLRAANTKITEKNGESNTPGRPRREAVKKSQEKDGPEILNGESNTPGRPRREAVKKSQEKDGPDILNQISLEFSEYKLAELVLSPSFVREMDWIDIIWPAKLKEEGYRPAVQYYFLTSASGCYTDFHIDFGGTSVWYHVLSGTKDFCLIEPTDQNLVAYEKWICSDDQAKQFLPDFLPAGSQAKRVKLQEGQTLIIPSGWIHSVYTPVDSLVFGGNFLHGLSIDMQIKVFEMERRTGVLQQYRFPYFLQLHFYSAGYYLRKLEQQTLAVGEAAQLETLFESVERWWGELEEEDDADTPSVRRVADEVASHNELSKFEDIITNMKKYMIKPAKQRSSDVQENTSGPPRDNLTEAPKPRLKLKIGSSKKEITPDPPATNEFKIGLKPSSTKASPNLYRRRQEDGAQEWLPENVDVRLGKSEKRTKKSIQNRFRPVKNSKRRVQDAPSTARQRLSKKLK